MCRWCVVVGCVVLSWGSPLGELSAVHLVLVYPSTVGKLSALLQELVEAAAPTSSGEGAAAASGGG